MGIAILENNGYIDKYIGDGLMALFGLKGESPKEICLNATKAALHMIDSLAEMNQYLKSHFDLEFKIGIGVHYGNAILGELGHPGKRQFTAIGDSVNGGVKVMAMALTIEQASGDLHVMSMKLLLRQSLQWAQDRSSGPAPIERAEVRRALAETAVRLEVQDALNRRCVWGAEAKTLRKHHGPMAKLGRQLGFGGT